MLPSMSTSPAMYDSTIDISFGGRSIRRRAAGRLSTSVNGARAPRSTAPSQNFTSNERWLGLPNSAFNTARHRDPASSSIRAAADCSSACAVDMIRKLWVSDSIVHTACDQMVRHRTNRVEHSVSGAWYGCHRIEQPPQIPRRDRAIRRPLRTDLLHSLRCRQFAQAIRSLDSFLNS